VQSYTRHQLKQDKFANFVSKEVQLATENRRSIIVAVALVAVALLIGIGTVTYINAQDEKASIALGNAMRIYTAPLRAPDAAAVPDTTTFTSGKERAQTALKEFSQTADKYSSTRNGKFARYMAGISASEAGDSKLAEQYLSEAASFRDKDLSSLAKFSLASLYRNEQRDSDAIRLYKELIDADSTTVPKTTAEFELAAFYEAKQQPAEAARLYQQIQKDEQASHKTGADKSVLAGAGAQKSAVEELASNKLAALKQADTQK
jgi:tetratricopeptide (TPR) repeat protein